MDKVRWLGMACLLCGRELNSWDVRCAKAVGYLKYQVCERCLCKEYDMEIDVFRDRMEAYFGIRPCRGL